MGDRLKRFVDVLAGTVTGLSTDHPQREKKPVVAAGVCLSASLLHMSQVAVDMGRAEIAQRHEGVRAMVKKVPSCRSLLNRMEEIKVLLEPGPKRAQCLAKQVSAV